MKILLLGANGQLGSDIIRMNAKSNTPFSIQALKRSDLDITDLKALHTTLSAYSFDILVNTTSYHNTEQVEANPHLAFTINAFAVKEMANICKEKRARFFHISTDYVFSHSNAPLTEKDAPSPLNIYGASKLMGESLAKAMYQDVVIFRVASLFGLAGASGKGGNFVETIIKNGKSKGQLRVISDQIMSPTSTADVANIILKAITVSMPAGIYHAVNSGNTSWFAFAKKIIEDCGVNAIVEPMPAKEYPSVAMRPSYSALDNNKLMQYIGDIPSWEDALKRYLVEKQHIQPR